MFSFRCFRLVVLGMRGAVGQSSMDFMERNASRVGHRFDSMYGVWRAKDNKAKHTNDGVRNIILRRKIFDRQKSRITYWDQKMGMISKKNHAKFRVRMSAFFPVLRKNV